MSSIHLFLLAVFLQTFLINSIESNSIRRHRRQQQQQQQQPSGTFYGSSNLPGASASAGYNYPQNISPYGTNLNNQGSKDLYGNPVIPPNTGNTMNMGLQSPQQQQHQQQQQQQQQQNQMFGATGQSIGNPQFPGSGPYPPNTLNQVGAGLQMRDSSGNIIPAGASGSSMYSPNNPQMMYPMNTNQGLTNKDSFNSIPNVNTNNQYGLNSNPYANTNTYAGQGMTNNNNNNPWANTNMNNQYNPNAGGNQWSTNRELNPNNNNNNAYSNPNSPYFYNNQSDRLMNGYVLLMVLFLAQIYFHL